MDLISVMVLTDCKLKSESNSAQILAYFKLIGIFSVILHSEVSQYLISFSFPIYKKFIFRENWINNYVQKDLKQRSFYRYLSRSTFRWMQLHRGILSLTWITIIRYSKECNSSNNGRQLSNFLCWERILQVVLLLYSKPFASLHSYQVV